MPGVEYDNGMKFEVIYSGASLYFGSSTHSNFIASNNVVQHLASAYFHNTSIHKYLE
jgi:hypothetical protein